MMTIHPHGAVRIGPDPDRTHRDRPNGGRASSEAGFTLVELLVVLAILTMLTTFVAPQVLRYLGKARSDSARIQISAIVSALELFAIENGGYPPPDVGLSALVQQPTGMPRWNGPYIKKAEGLIDPWGRPYGYRINSTNGQVTVFSLGRDNAVGGTGEDSDIAN
jgi:general secretion pathway protein G